MCVYDTQIDEWQGILITLTNVSHQQNAGCLTILFRLQYCNKAKWVNVGVLHSGSLLLLFNFLWRVIIANVFLAVTPTPNRLCIPWWLIFPMGMIFTLFFSAQNTNQGPLEMFPASIKNCLSPESFSGSFAEKSEECILLNLMYPKYDHLNMYSILTLLMRCFLSFYSH